MLYEPPSDARWRTRIGDYLHWLEYHRHLRFPDYYALWEWSVTDTAAFWSSVVEYFDIPFHTPPVEVVSTGPMPDVRWFSGAMLNYAEAALRLPGLRNSDKAVIGRSQTRAPKDYTVAQLREQVARVRTGLLRLGVGRGDRVAAYLPNIPETVVLLLACASLGAIFTACPPEFDARAVIGRLLGIEPKVLVAVDGYRDDGAPIDRTAEIATVRATVSSIEHVVLLPYLDTAGRVPHSILWSSLTNERGPLIFDPVPFDHPLHVLYTSGTTGPPKAVVHSHGGILLEHMKALALQHDLGPSDRLFWHTTTGWMAWHHLVSGLAVGAAIVLYDGRITHRSQTELWRIATETRTSNMGVDASFLTGCENSATRKVELPRLRGLFATGATLPAETYQWVYDHFGPDLRFASIVTNTELCGAVLGGSPLLPVHAGRMACRCLGAAVESHDPDGNSMLDRFGELTLTRPMPSMPLGFWGDIAQIGYYGTYFAKDPGNWRHDDLIAISSDGTATITGHAGAAIRRGGKPVATAEFYQVIESLRAVSDSLVVETGEPSTGSSRLRLFVVLAPGFTLDDGLRARLDEVLSSALSPHHVPDSIHAISVVPRTLSGKKLEIPAKLLLAAAPTAAVVTPEALADPEPLAPFS